MVNGAVAKQWSRTQATHALSPAEAEYNAVIAAATGCGDAMDVNGLGHERASSSWTDSRGAKAMASKRRLGKNSTHGVEALVVARHVQREE